MTYTSFTCLKRGKICLRRTDSGFTTIGLVVSGKHLWLLHPYNAPIQQKLLFYWCRLLPDASTAPLPLSLTLCLMLCWNPVESEHALYACYVFTFTHGVVDPFVELTHIPLESSLFAPCFNSLSFCCFVLYIFMYTRQDCASQVFQHRQFERLVFFTCVKKCMCVSYIMHHVCYFQ